MPPQQKPPLTAEELDRAFGGGRAPTRGKAPVRGKAAAPAAEGDLLSKASAISGQAFLPLALTSLLGIVGGGKLKTLGKFAGGGLSLASGTQAADAARKGNYGDAALSGAIAAIPLAAARKALMARKAGTPAPPSATPPPAGAPVPPTAAPPPSGPRPGASSPATDLIDAAMKRGKKAKTAPAPAPATAPAPAPGTAPDLNTIRRMLAERRNTIRREQLGGRDVPEAWYAEAAENAAMSTQLGRAAATEILRKANAAVPKAAKAAKAATTPEAADLATKAKLVAERLKTANPSSTPVLDDLITRLEASVGTKGVPKTAPQAKVPTGKVRKSTPPVVETNPFPGNLMPDELRNVHPTYAVGKRTYELAFDDAMDLAGFMVANKAPNAEMYMKYLGHVTGMTPSEIRIFGAGVKDRLRVAAKDVQKGVDYILLPRSGIRDRGADIAKAAPRLVTPKDKDIADAGFAMTQLLTHLAGAGVGAVGGALAGDELRPPESERSPTTWRLTGAALGATAGLLGANFALTPTLAGKLEKAQNWNFFSLLSGPTAMAKANIGAVSSVFIGAVERMALGQHKAAAAGLRQFLDDTKSGLWFKVFASPNPAAFLPTGAAQGFTRAARATNFKGFTSLPSRVIAAGDVVSTRALLKMGVPRDEIFRMNLSGDPQTAMGREFVRFMGETVKFKTPTGKLNAAGEPILRTVTLRPRDYGPYAKLFMRWFIPFPRVVASAAERAVAYSPAALTPWARKTFSEVPGQIMSEAQAMRRVQIGLGSTAGGALASSQLGSPETDPLIAAAAGPTAGLAALGSTLLRAKQSDQPFGAAVKKYAETLPMIGENLTWPWERIIPAGLSKVAETLDPAYDRQKGDVQVAQARQRSGNAGSPSMLESVREAGATMSAGIRKRLPLIRESLPEAYAPVDNRGRPLFDDRPPFLPDITLRGPVSSWKIVAPKVLTARPSTNPPGYRPGDPLDQWLRNLEREAGGPSLISPPSQPLEDSKISEMSGLSGQPSPRINRDVRLDIQRAKGAASEIPLESLRNSPSFNAMPLEQQAMIIRRLVQTTRPKVGGITGKAADASLASPDMIPDIRRSLQLMIRNLQIPGGR